MAAFSRGLRTFGSTTQSTEYICSRCLGFSTSTTLSSGHSRWSKIKHDKGTADARLAKKRTVLSHEIANASKFYGSDPTTNPKLAAVIAVAKKAGFPKVSMEAAIARGQGKSASGAALENLTLEAILPPSIAFVIDIETDNRRRTLSELRLLIKKYGATVSSTSFLFTRMGRVVFENDDRGLEVDEVLDEAIEAGAEDVEVDEEGNLVVWTDPTGTTGAADALLNSLGLKVRSSDIIWSPNDDTMVPVDSEETFVTLSGLVDSLLEHVNVQGVHTNVVQGVVDADAWSDLQDKLAV